MFKALLALSLLMAVSTFVFAQTRTIHRDVRNSSGKLIYNNTTRGNITETRDPSGKLLMRSKTTDAATEVRDSSGRLIERIKNR